jgi:hypothetical protein
MELTTPQLQVLKTNIAAVTDPVFVGYRNAGNYGQMATWYNEDSTFVVYKTSEFTQQIGAVTNYIANAALTADNRDKINFFYLLNPTIFAPDAADQRQYLADAYSGALGGEGANTRAALDALYRKFALRGEQIYSTGTGTTLAPGALNATAFGDITPENVQDALALP